MRALIFGDSIAYGSWATDGWVELLKQEAHRRTLESRGATKLQVLNLGVGGDSSTKILERMTNEIKCRQSAKWELAFIFSFGTNDQRTTDGTLETSIDQFEANVRTIIREAKVYSDKILFVGTPPIGQPVATLSGKEYSDERVRVYEERLVAILQAENIPFVPIRPAFEQVGLDELYSYDHLHPGDKGHKLIVDTVLPAFDELVSYASSSQNI